MDTDQDLDQLCEECLREVAEEFGLTLKEAKELFDITPADLKDVD